MGAKKYTIRILIDDAPATGAVNRIVRSFADMEARALKGARASESSMKAQVVGLEQLAVSGLKLQDKIARAGEAAAAKAKATAEKKAVDIQAIEDRYLKRDYDQRVAYEKRKQSLAEREAAKASAVAEREAARKERSTVRLYTREEALAKAKTEAIRRENDKLIAKELEAMGIQGRRWANGFEGCDRLIEGVKTLAGQFVALGSASNIVNTIAESFTDAQRTAMDAAKFTGEYRESLLELAALKDRLGDTTGEMRENIVFRAKTLQGKTEAAMFQSAALGVGESAIDTADRKGLISRDEFEKAMIFGGKFQAMEHGSAETHGQLVGQVPALIGRRTNAEEVAAMEAKLYSIFKPGGAEFTPMVQGYLKNAKYATSGVISPERLAAVESALSVTNKEGHQAATEQFIRATAGGIGRLKGPKIEGEDVEKIGPYLKRLGVTEKMDPIEIGHKISDDLAKQEAAGRNLKVYLQEKGYGNQEEAGALLQFYGMRKSGQFKAFEDLAGKKADATNLRNRIDDFQALDPTMQARSAKLGSEVADVHLGAGANEYYESLTRRAFDKLKVEKKLTGKYEDAMTSGYTDILGNARRDMVEQEAAEIQRREAERVGLKTGLRVHREYGIETREHRFKPKAWTYEGRAEEAYSHAQEIAKAGGDPLGQDLKTLVNLTEQQLRNQERQIEEARAARNNKPMPIGAGAGARMAR